MTSKNTVTTSTIAAATSSPASSTTTDNQQQKPQLQQQQPAAATRQSSFLLKRKGLTINIDRSNEHPNIESDENIYLIKEGEDINDCSGFRKPQSLTQSSVIPVNNNNNNNNQNNNNSNEPLSPSLSPLSTSSSAFTDSESSAPNTPVSSNYFNCTPKSLSQSAPSIKLKINLNNLNNNQQLRQLQQANSGGGNNNNKSNTTTTTTTTSSKELGNSSSTSSSDDEPPESSRWLGCDNDKFKIFDPICSKVTDYLYMGSETVASDREKLASFGITHILNVSHQCANFFEHDTSLVYKKFPLLDNPTEDISLIFNQAIEFIESACAVNGRVFVHCQMGVSRSASICMLWIMKATRCSFEEASDLIKLIRPISRPNAGFQLCLLNWAIKEGIQAPNSHRCNNIDINTISARFQNLSLAPNILANLSSLATSEKSSFTIDDSN
ncbi:hypothetical protein CYY_008096 [Polysphondylium violaceum]|uniref:Protein-serine/threonine phosphatase n=1 Tax=Polysphondylium violaceum TaxID=133409 RepID=A0A8J4UQF0_9MYCE|nr:hypothetical protein CYY_008096 [Polysphondylium violaceum]